MPRDIRSSILDRLPTILPRKTKIVSEERHEFSYIGSSDSSAKTVYELDEAPFQSIKTVTARVNNKRVELPPEAYDTRSIVSSEPDSIAFTDPSFYPDNGTEFIVTYKIIPKIQRYVEPFDTDIERVDDRLDTIKSSHYVGTADTDELELIATFFGELGDRRDRSAQSYRRFLSSIVASFDARGTVPGVKFVLDAAFGINKEDATVIEDFESQAYSLEFIDWPAVNSGNVKSVVEIADASGVKFRGLTFITNPVKSRVTTSATSVVDRGQIGVFYGFDRFNADGAFASGERNDVFAERTSSIADIQTQTEPLSDTTVVEGFADSVFSVGEFDGVRDKTLTLTETVIDPVQFFALVANIQTATQSERPQRRFGVFEFDGLDVSVTTSDVNTFVFGTAQTTDETVTTGFSQQSAFDVGLFDGNSDPIVSRGDTALNPVVINAASEQPDTESTVQSFGSGSIASGVLDGINDLEDSHGVEITTISIPSIIVASALVSSQTIQRDQFAGGVFDGPIQRETTLITPTTITPTSAQTADETIITGGISGDVFDGSIQRDITQSSIGTVSVSPNLTIEQTDQSFGSGAFAAGVLDGVADEPVSVSETQSQSARIDKTVTLTNDRHIQSFGSGAFAAGVLDGGSDTTVLSSNTQTQISEVHTTPAVTSGITSETDGFGSGSFSGSADFT